MASHPQHPESPLTAEPMAWDEIDPALIERIVQKTMEAPFQKPDFDGGNTASLSPQALLKWQPVLRMAQTPPMPDYTFRPFNFTDREANFQPIQSVTNLAASRVEGDLADPPSHAREDRHMTTDKPLSYNRVQSAQCVSQCQKKGETMVDLSGYKDLTKPPAGTDFGATATLESAAYQKESETEQPTMTTSTTSPLTTRSSGFSTQPETSDADHDTAYTDYTGNVRTLLKLVSDLPNEVTKQSGAQVIRLTMEAMGISMENVLSEAQSAQSDLLDGVRTNIKKIEEYKTVIRKLESEIKSLQGKANELSEIIDLFILSNASPNQDKSDVY